MKRIVKIFTIMLLISLMLISSIVLIKDNKTIYEEEKIFETLDNITAEKDTAEENVDIKNIKGLYKENSDIVGWIEIENTNINYPVMQTKNSPDYYLRRNFYKEYSLYGTPYLEEECVIEESSNLIIYGHNIKGNKMFGELEKYKNKKFYDEHQIINFYTMNEISKYEIIAVLKTSIDNGFKYYKYINFYNKEIFDEYIENSLKYSIYEMKKDGTYEDKYITLSTCEYSAQNGRLVIVGRKII